ncbi:MAG: Ldh family oxidoreductase [Chloroflexi bacterium]|nr:Ldh family oxidoreductase [Chloroflexota bacterium]
MAGYPVSGDERRVPLATLVALVTDIFARCGMRDDDAALLAGSLATADLRGVHSHGVLRVPEYVDKLTTGGVDPAGRPVVVRDAGAALVIDGGNSMGQIGGTFAMRHAIERAGTTGVAVAAVRGSNHCGAMAAYAMLALDAGMVGLATTDALPSMAPWGARDRILGINPLSIAIPAGEERPIVLDFAFSGAAVGKIRVFQQKGLAIPSDWAFDADGHPTTDPAAALTGLLQPIGGYKGTGLALAMGLLSTLLAGAAYGTELGSLETGPRPGQDGHFFQAIDIAAFEEPARFRARVDGVIRQLHAARRAPGVDRIYAPGELEFETEDRYRAGGIPLNDATLAGLTQTAARLGVDASSLRSSV